MLLKQATLDGIVSGEISLAFRRWRRPTVRTGGTLLTAVGQLEIGTVTAVEAEEITAADARRAGFGSKAELLAELERWPDGRLYRIEFGAMRADPRVALREDEVDAEAAIVIADRLRRLDEASTDGAWTEKTLRLLNEKPGVRAGDLCVLVGQERDHFKRNVRKLKNLGLTESLGIGYRLSPRGASLLEWLRGTRTWDSE